MTKKIEEYIKTNYHTHIYLCKHALGTVNDFVEKAISLKYQTIAITDHGPFPNDLQNLLHSRRMSFDEYNTIYLKLLAKAKEEYKQKIEVLSGIEIEYLDELLPYYQKFAEELDFLILGQHYLKVNNKTKSIFSLNFSKHEIDIYVNTVVKAMETGLFKIIAHPEIFSWSIVNWNEDCENASKTIIASAIKNNVILEINVNGIRNSIYKNRQIMKDGKLDNFPYPRKEFFTLASEMGAKVMINDDAHSPNCLCDEYTKLVYTNILNYGKLNLVNKI